MAAEAALAEEVPVAPGKNWSKKHFDEEGLLAIKSSVKQAEKTTNVEIIPVIEYSASTIQEGLYYLKLLKVVLAFIPSISLSLFLSTIVFRFFEIWMDPVYFHGIGALVLYVFFYYLFWHFSKPILPKGLYQIFALAKVKQDFSQAKEYETKNQESFLIYGFLREKVLVVYGDAKIFRQLSEEEVKPMLDLFFDNAKNGKMSKAYVDCITYVSSLLARDFPKTACDEDEVKNDLVIKE